jgi:hypothetical protein
MRTLFGFDDSHVSESMNGLDLKPIVRTGA